MRKPRFDTSCKLGTMPKLVRLHGNDKPEIGRLVRVQDGEGAKWQGVLVTKINDDGYFFADLMMGCGVPAGTTSAYQVVNSYPATPASIIVGTSGKKDERAGVVAASGRGPDETPAHPSSNVLQNVSSARPSSSRSRWGSMG